MRGGPVTSFTLLCIHSLQCANRQACKRNAKQCKSLWSIPNMSGRLGVSYDVLCRNLFCISCIPRIPLLYPGEIEIPVIPLYSGIFVESCLVSIWERNCLNTLLLNTRRAPPVLPLHFLFWQDIKERGTLKATENDQSQSVSNFTIALIVPMVAL